MSGELGLSTDFKITLSNRQTEVCRTFFGGATRVFKLRSFVTGAAVLSALMLSATGSSRSLAADDKIIGRCDMTIHEAGGGGEYPSWFEATRDGDKLTGRFVGRVGSQRPIKSISFEKGH